MGFPPLHCAKPSFVGFVHWSTLEGRKENRCPGWKALTGQFSQPLSLFLLCCPAPCSPSLQPWRPFPLQKSPVSIYPSSFAVKGLVFSLCSVFFLVWHHCEGTEGAGWAVPQVCLTSVVPALWLNVPLAVDESVVFSHIWEAARGMRVAVLAGCSPARESGFEEWLESPLNRHLAGLVFHRKTSSECRHPENFKAEGCVAGVKQAVRFQRQEKDGFARWEESSWGLIALPQPSVVALLCKWPKLASPFPALLNGLCSSHSPSSTENCWLQRENTSPH